MNKPKKDYYAILKINNDATQEQINKSYRKLAMEWHPDRHKEPEKKKEADALHKITILEDKLASFVE